MTNTMKRAVEAIWIGWPATTRHVRNERGIAVPLAAVFMTVLVAMAAVGVDTGRVAAVATEAQNAADIAALAAARAIADEEDATGKAMQVLSTNKINALAAGAFLNSLTLGNLDSNNLFMANGTPTNAVRARMVSQINTVLLGAIGYPNATVTREAVAAFGGLGAAVPTLPIVVGECNFITTCMHDSCMPAMDSAPNTSNNSAWTGYFTGANNTNIGNLMEEPAGLGNTTVVKVGDYVNLLNGGAQQPLLTKTQMLLDAGKTEFLIPVVDCTGSATQSKQVRGFAKVVIDYVKTVGNPKGIQMHTVYEATTGTPGGGSFGLNVVTLAK